MCQTNIVEKIKKHVLCSVIFFQKFAICYVMWKNTVTIQMTMWHMCIACYVPTATDTYTQIMYYLLLFHCNSGYMNVPQYSIICTLTILLISVFFNWQVES